MDNPLAQTFGTRLWGINDHGEITGTFGDSNASGQGFTYNNGSYTLINIAGSRSSTGTDVNNYGQVAVDYYDGHGHGAIYDNGTVLAYINDPFGSFGTGIMGINDAGLVVGDFANGAINQGYIYDNGVYTTFSPFSDTHLNDINNNGQIVGDYARSTASFIYDPSNNSLTTLVYPGADQTLAFGINDLGVVSGRYHDSSGYHGFTFEDLQFSSIDHPNAPGNTFVNKINDSGQIVGYYIDATGFSHGFLATPCNDGHLFG